MKKRRGQLMAKTISPSQFASAIIKEMELYADATTATVDEVVNDVRKGAAKAVQKKARSYGWGEYADNITSKKQTGKRGATAWVYVKAPFYRLAHLLENGHALRNGKRSKEFPHFADGDAYINDNYEKELKGRLER